MKMANVGITTNVDVTPSKPTKASNDGNFFEPVEMPSQASDE